MHNFIQLESKRALPALLALAAANTLQAQTATQTVTFAVNAINQIAFAGAPSLTITTAVAGSAATSWTAICTSTASSRRTSTGPSTSP